MAGWNCWGSSTTFSTSRKSRRARSASFRKISISADLATRIAQQFEPVAKEKGVAFHIRVDETLPEILHTDGQRVEQIMKNLLSNAFKFTEVGSVTLDMHRVKDDVELQRASLTPSQTIAFSVIDTGIGIEKSKFKDIFEAFQQEDGSTDRHYGGTGLGLTIARKFAHVLGGEIHVASGKGEGSTFTLFLPLVTGERSAADASSRRPVQLPCRSRAGSAPGNNGDAQGLRAHVHSRRPQIHRPGRQGAAHHRG